MGVEYSPVGISEQAPLYHENDEFDFSQHYRQLRRYIAYLVATIAFLVFLAVSLIIFIIVRGSSDVACTAQLQGWSPLLSAVEYEELNFDNEFLHQTKYRGPPTNHIELEWERLWNHDLVSIPHRDFHHLNKSTDQRFMEAPGGLAANLDVFHQIHCLNLIRQYTWRDYYDQHSSTVDKPTDMTRADAHGLRVHVDHCIETLRLTLMCHGDVTPYLIVMQSEDDKLGVADFNANHKCRNFDKIVDEFTKRTVIERWPDPVPFPSKQYEIIPGLD